MCDFKDCLLHLPRMEDICVLLMPFVWNAQMVMIDVLCRHGKMLVWIDICVVILIVSDWMQHCLKWKLHPPIPPRCLGKAALTPASPLCRSFCQSPWDASQPKYSTVTRMLSRRKLHQVTWQQRRDAWFVAAFWKLTSVLRSGTRGVVRGMSAATQMVLLSLPYTLQPRPCSVHLTPPGCTRARAPVGGSLSVAQSECSKKKSSWQEQTWYWAESPSIHRGEAGYLVSL